MEINGKEVPFTATHYNKVTGEFIRIGKGQYAQCYLNDKYWVDCSLLRNEHLPGNGGNRPVNTKYRQLFKTGMSRDVCNIRLMWIGSSYRIR